MQNSGRIIIRMIKLFGGWPCWKLRRVLRWLPDPEGPRVKLKSTPNWAPGLRAFQDRPVKRAVVQKALNWRTKMTDRSLGVFGEWGFDSNLGFGVEVASELDDNKGAVASGCSRTWLLVSTYFHDEPIGFWLAKSPDFATRTISQGPLQKVNLASSQLLGS